MGNRCYVAQVDKENKKIEMFYNHWNGAWDSIEPTLDLAKHLNTDFKGLAKINELAFNYGKLREEPYLIEDSFNIANFCKDFDPGDNGIYFINKDFELKYHYQKIGLIEDIMHDYDGILEHIIKENKLNINVKDVKRHNLFENKTNIDEVTNKILKALEKQYGKLEQYFTDAISELIQKELSSINQNKIYLSNTQNITFNVSCEADYDSADTEFWFYLEESEMIDNLRKRLGYFRKRSMYFKLSLIDTKTFLELF